MDLISKLFENEFAYTYLRVLIAGDQQRVKDFIKSQLKKYVCRNILDVCCGTGDFAVVVNGRQTYVGFDNNPKYIAYAKKKYALRNTAFFVKDALSYDPKEKFDAVLLISTMHHFSDGEMRTILHKVKQRVGKIIIVADLIPNPPNLVSKLFVLMDRGNFIRAREDKVKLLKKDFEIIKTTTIRCGFAYQYCMVGRPKKTYED